MKQYLLSFIVLLGVVSVSAQCDIATLGIQPVNVFVVRTGSAIDVEFAIANIGTDVTCEYPAQSVKVIVSLPGGAPFATGFTFNSFTASGIENNAASPMTFFTWNYNPGSHVFEGVNHTAIPNASGEVVTIKLNAMFEPVYPKTYPILLSIINNDAPGAPVFPSNQTENDNGQTTLTIIPQNVANNVVCPADEMPPSVFPVHNCTLNPVPAVVTSFNACGEGTRTYTYTFFGCPGNLSSFTWSYTNIVDDDIVPVLVLNGAATMEVCQNAVFTDPGANASDNCNGDITSSISSNVISTAAPGTYTITYNVADLCSNAAVPVTRTVIVHPEPVISFGFNGVEAGHNAVFSYCYNETVEVSLFAEYSGTAPFSITYTVNGGSPVTVNGLNAGEIISPSQLYAAGVYNIAVTDITDANGCKAGPAFLALATATITIHPEPQADFMVNSTLLSFPVNTAEFCYSDGPLVFKLNSLSAGMGPVNLSWEVFVNGNPVPDPTYSGSAGNVSAGGILFTAPAPLIPGSYVVQITSFTDAKGCLISPAILNTYYNSTITIHPEPQADFMVNSTLLSFPVNTAEFCYSDGPLVFKLNSLSAGMGPVNLSWEVFVNGNPVADPLYSGSASNVSAGGTLFTAPAPLIPGSYVVQITSFTDAKGCSISPAILNTYYYSTITIHPEPQADFMVNSTLLSFPVNTAEFCYSDGPLVFKLNSLSAGMGPVNLSWEVFVNGNPVPDPTYSGSAGNVSAGGILFTAPAPLIPGSYVVQITSFTDAKGCLISPAILNTYYNSTITIHPEPQADFMVNSTLLSFPVNTAEFCYSDGPLVFKLNSLSAGMGPVNLSWEVFVNGNPVADPLYSGSASNVSAGGTLFTAPAPLIPGSYVVQITSFTDAKGCSISPAILNTYYYSTITIHPEPQADFMVNSTLLSFPVNTAEFCYSDGPLVFKLNSLSAGMGPVNLSWEVFVNGNPVPDPTYSGSASNVSAGGTLFTAPAPLIPGSYVVQITSFTDAKGCSISPAILNTYYNSTITIHPEPQADFMVNSTLLSFPVNTAEFCYSDGPLVFKLNSLSAGMGPVNLSWEVFVNGNPVPDPTYSGSAGNVSAGGTLFTAPAPLIPGSYVVQITSFTDAKGCSISPAILNTYYNSTITIHPEPDVFFTIDGNPLLPFEIIPYCYDVTDITLALVDQQGVQMAQGTAPFTFSFTISNGGIDGSFTNIPYGNIGNLLDYIPKDIFNQPLPGDYLVEITSFADANGCVLSNGALNFYKFTIRIQPKPTLANVIPSAAMICDGEMLFFTANGLLNGLNEFNYTVTGPGGPFNGTYSGVAVAGSFTFPAANYSGEGIYNITINSIKVNDCVALLNTNNTASFEIKPYPTFTALLVSDNILCFGDGVSFTATGLMDGQTTFNYIVNGNPGSYSTLVSGNMVNFPSDIYPPGTYQIELVSLEKNGCLTTLNANNVVVFTVRNQPIGQIAGGGTATLNSPVLLSVNFTGSGGTAPYTFTYKIGILGTPQVVTSSAFSSSVSIAHPNDVLGTFEYILISVVDANGCEGQLAPTPPSVFVYVINNIDLSPTIPSPLNANFVSSDPPREGYIQFTNGGNGPTVGQVTFRISKVANFAIAIPPLMMTSGSFPFTVSVNNPQWTITEGLFFYTLTADNPNIPAGGDVKIGIILTPTGPPGSSGNLTATIINGTGGDVNDFNNVAIRTFVIN
jgi:glycyl-tRNA synthetase alpha subunit